MVCENCEFELKVSNVPTIVPGDVILASIRANLCLPLCFRIRHRMLRNGGGGPQVPPPLSPLLSVMSVPTR